MSFWSIDELDFNDPLNREIWSQSPEEQERIQPYRNNWIVGEIGAQQAMRHPFRLPWVPDPVGRDWQTRDALIICGSAYGPFIGGDGRIHEVQPRDYAACTSSAEFSKLFFQKVIRARSYYSQIAELASAAVRSCRLVALVDLCRVAFVRVSPLRDIGNDRIVRDNSKLFTTYIDSPIANQLLWRRIFMSQATTIVALGTIAEHGILRLFARNLRGVSICDSQNPTIRFFARDNDHRWPAQYAHILRKLHHRKEAPTPPYWDIRGNIQWNLAKLARCGRPSPYGGMGPSHIISFCGTSCDLRAEVGLGYGASNKGLNEEPFGPRGDPRRCGYVALTIPSD